MTSSTGAMAVRKAKGKRVLRYVRRSEATNQKHLGTAEIPEYREQINRDTEYRDFPEEKIWSPQQEVNEWVPFYVFMARSVLTFVQESQGIPNREAMENSCTGYAEQYITDVLHDSEYLPEVALKTLLSKELPRKLSTRWTTADTELFVEGITTHGKNFTRIQKNLLPQKETKDIVDFYYAWKWSEPAKQLRNCRRRRRTRTQKHFPSISCIYNELSSSRIVTRSATAAFRTSRSSSSSAEKTSSSEKTSSPGNKDREKLLPAGSPNCRMKRKRSPMAAR